jgi:hypothetical protein
MFPELGPRTTGQTAEAQTVPGGGFKAKDSIQNVFVFQFWPQQVQDNYTPNYATKQIPGGSHPILQWTGGSGRNISFTAQFVSEIREGSYKLGTKHVDFRSRVTQGAAGSILSDTDASSIESQPLQALLLPSARYTVNVAAAIAALQQYLYPTYDGENQERAIPPKKLVLVLPGTKLGRSDNNDGILCVMKGASVTMESWFPDGELRSASVALSFSEIVQLSTGGENVSNIKYIGAESYTTLADKYLAQASNPNDLSIN